MIVEPRLRGNVCTTAHPAGCARQVRAQIEYILARRRARGPIGGAGRALVVGSSNGYGLAARIAAAFGCGASTVGVALERGGGGNRTGTPGWYNDREFLAEAERAALPAWSVNGDAFSREVKEEAVSLVKSRLGGIDLLVYSIASPRRVDPETGEVYATSIKPLKGPFASRTLDFSTGRVTEVAAEPATELEIAHTVKVMGGEDWELWVEALERSGALAEGFTTVAFSYVGPRLTAPIYRDGTIGKAKAHLETAARKLHSGLAPKGGRAYVSINKALLTRASAVIPAVPLYVALLYRVMKEKGVHEGCIEQMARLFEDRLYAPGPVPLDDEGRIRMDDLEMRPDVQRGVESLWRRIEGGDLSALGDIGEFRLEFLRHHGFGMDGVDYLADVEV